MARIGGAGSALFAGIYDYVIPLSYDYNSALTADSLSIGGAIGIAILAADVPQTGAAQYVGDPFARFTSTDGLIDFFLTNGISIVDADFAAGSVNVTMGLFTRVNGIDGLPTTSPADALSGTGMTIVGASFRGETWATLKDGGVVNFTGPGTAVSAGGESFGHDTGISGPNEIGGYHPDGRFKRLCLRCIRCRLNSSCLSYEFSPNLHSRHSSDACHRHRPGPPR